jgi:hypothetical protein
VRRRTDRPQGRPRYPQSYFEGSIPLSVDDVKKVEKQWAEDGQAVVDA